MILAINIGNTTINSAIIGEQPVLVEKCAISTHPVKTEDEYFSILQSILNLKSYDIKAIVISSVVPRHTEIFMRLGIKFFSIQPQLLDAMSASPFLQIDIDLPETLGSDMVASSIAALNKYTGDIMLIDLGTATTCSVVSASGVFKGTAISIGINTFADALYSKTALLPYIPFKSPKKGEIIGKNTEDSMLSGMYYNYIGGLKNMIEAIRKEYNTPLKIVATGGGLSQLTQEEFDLLGIDFIEPDLILLGLYYYIYMRGDND